jgi:hypothetical protein
MGPRPWGIFSKLKRSKLSFGLQKHLARLTKHFSFRVKAPRDHLVTHK